MPITTVVFIVDAIPSHIFSSMGVARRLRARGMTVEYWGIARNGSDTLIADQGFAFRELDGLWSRYQEDIRLPTSLRSFMQRCPEIGRILRARRRRWELLGAALDRFEHALECHLRGHRPDVVVLDPFLLAYYPFLHRRSVPTVALSTKPLPIRDPGVPPYDSALVPTASAWSRALVALSWVRPRVADAGRRFLRSVARRLRVYTYHDILHEASRREGFSLRDELVARWVEPDLHFRSVQEWALWIAETDLPRQRRLPSNVRYIGPSVDVERAQVTPPVRRASRTQRLIYVAVGTVRFRWKDNLAFLRKVTRAFDGMPNVLVVISTGDARATEALGAPPSNVQVFDFLPQIKMLEIADLVITHAGAGTYRECIEKQVPMLAYPRNHDQIGNAARIVYHRVGLRGSRRWDRPSVIRRKALRVMADISVHRNLERLRAAVHASEAGLLSAALSALGGTSASENGGRDVGLFSASPAAPIVGRGAAR